MELSDRRPTETEGVSPITRTCKWIAPSTPTSKVVCFISLSLEKGTHFEGESRPSDDLLSVPEAHSAEPRRDNKVSEIVKQRERVNSFIKSLPESLSA